MWTIEALDEAVTVFGGSLDLLFQPLLFMLLHCIDIWYVWRQVKKGVQNQPGLFLLIRPILKVCSSKTTKLTETWHSQFESLSDYLSNGTKVKTIKKQIRTLKSKLKKTLNWEANFAVTVLVYNIIDLILIFDHHFYLNCRLFVICLTILKLTPFER